MAAPLNPDQVAAMDETMAYDAAHHAEAALIRRIGTRQGLLATGPLFDAQRRELEAANDLDEQELAIRQAMRKGAPAEAAFWAVIVILSMALVVNLLYLFNFWS